jgi:hypothetical protein
MEVGRRGREGLKAISLMMREMLRLYSLARTHLSLPLPLILKSLHMHRGQSLLLQMIPFFLLHLLHHLLLLLLLLLLPLLLPPPVGSITTPTPFLFPSLLLLLLLVPFISSLPILPHPFRRTKCPFNLPPPPPPPPPLLLLPPPPPSLPSPKTRSMTLAISVHSPRRFRTPSLCPL